MIKETHIIYGYREIGGRQRWYIGKTRARRWRHHHNDHKRADARTKFHNFLRKGYREGKSFDQLVERFELETFFGTNEGAGERSFLRAFV